MKTLKVNHELAEFIRSGGKTITWRLYDDKDLSVNDEVELVDKIDARNPSTWRVMGIARITKIVQKRLADIHESDFEGQRAFQTQHEMLKAYKSYYGADVSTDTPVKIIHFSFKPVDENYIKSETKNTTILREVKLYADGGSRGNPGPSASGFAISDMEGQSIVKKGIYLGVTTNNQAEYQALKLGLEEAAKLQVQNVHVYMDSLLVINQMLGKFKVKNRDLWPIHAAIKELVPKFKKVSFTHVPRELNKVADREVNIALDNALKR
jgi:ribonuclease HI